MTFPWGKHCGEALELVRRATWRGHSRSARSDRRSRARCVRSSAPALPVAVDPPHELVAPVRELIKAGFRSLTRARHPDRGGSNAAMRAVLEAHDWLREAVKGAA